MNKEQTAKFLDLLQDYQELQTLLPEDFGGRMLALINKKAFTVFSEMLPPKKTDEAQDN